MPHIREHGDPKTGAAQKPTGKLGKTCEDNRRRAEQRRFRREGGGIKSAPRFRGARFLLCTGIRQSVHVRNTDASHITSLPYCVRFVLPNSWDDRLRIRLMASVDARAGKMSTAPGHARFGRRESTGLP